MLLPISARAELTIKLSNGGAFDKQDLVNAAQALSDAIKEVTQKENKISAYWMHEGEHHQYEMRKLTGENGKREINLAEAFNTQDSQNLKCASIYVSNQYKPDEYGQWEFYIDYIKQDNGKEIISMGTFAWCSSVHERNNNRIVSQSRRELKKQERAIKRTFIKNLEIGNFTVKQGVIPVGFGRKPKKALKL